MKMDGVLHSSTVLDLPGKKAVKNPLALQSQSLEVYRNGIKPLKEVCLNVVNGLSDDELSKVREIQESDKLSSDFEISKDGTKLLVSSEYYRTILETALKSKEVVEGSDGSKEKDFSEGIHYRQIKNKETVDFTEKEKEMHTALENVNSILRRLFGRRTGMTSWILFGVLKNAGYVNFTKDDYYQIQNDLTDPSFTRVFTEYYSRYKKDRQSAQEYIESVYKNSDIKKQKLAGLAAKVIDICDRLPVSVVKNVPKMFCFQNVGIPLAMRFLTMFKMANSDSPLIRLLDFVRTINPWLDEFGAGQMGIFKKEIEATKENLVKIDQISNDTVQGEKINKQRKPNSIKIVDLDIEENTLKDMMKNVNAAGDRLFGRDSTISSQVAKFLLRHYKFGNYQDLASKTFEREEFVQKLCSQLKQSSSTKGIKRLHEIYKGIDKEFSNPMEKGVARAAVGIISIAKNMSEFVIEKLPKYFGIFYSPQYLFMPIITKFVKEDTTWGKIFSFVRDINPFLNDAFFDLVATFRDEILDIRRQANRETVSGLIPDSPMNIDSVIGYSKSLFETIKALPKKWAKTN